MRTGTHRSCSRRRPELSLEFRVEGRPRTPGPGRFRMRSRWVIDCVGLALPATVGRGVGRQPPGSSHTLAYPGAVSSLLAMSPNTGSVRHMCAPNPEEVVVNELDADELP